MANPRKKKEAAAAISSEQIQADIAAFLKKGGAIEEVPRGVSGNSAFKGNRSITLGRH
ncbi:MAG TPA: hypothetical protein VIN71_13505 [Pseudomonadales bacterium]